MYYPTCHNTAALENPDKTDRYTQPLTILKNFYLLQKSDLEKVGL